MKLLIVHSNHVNRVFFSLPPWMQKLQYGLRWPVVYLRKGELFVTFRIPQNGDLNLTI